MNFRMLRFAKQIVWVAALALLVLSRESARAFALEGPIANGPDAYQTLEIGYDIPGLDLSAVKSIGQEFRRNTPIMYYAADYNFLQYFGAQGLTALDQAFAIYNEITNVDLYTSNLVEFPLQAERINSRAAALLLTDVKSVTMGLMTEQLGLWQPVRAVWVLRSRFSPPGSPPCPAGELYNVMPRNIDVVTDPVGQFQYTSYVNGTLYSYFIFEDCGTGSPPLPDADAEEFPVSPIPDTGAFSAVADWESEWYSGLNEGFDGFGGGGYYTGMTRDDVAGLRYLIDTNNYNLETTGPGTVQFTTNAPAIITNMDLGELSAAALTNGPVALAALYPGLIITSTTNTFALLVTTNITETLTNSPYDPAGYPPTHPLYSTNRTTNVIATYEYTFGNVVTNSYATRGLVGTVTLGLTNSPYAPAGTPATILTNAKLSYVNGTFGSFFLLPTNLCGIQIISNLLTTVIATTNLPVIVTNGAAGTTGTTTTNATIAFTPGTITFFTNSTILYLPVTCPEDTSATRQGVGQLTFIRRDFDSLLNQFWDPVTNTYTMYALTNGFIVPQQIQRVVTTPDFLFDASDIGTVGVDDDPVVFQRNVTFDITDVPTNSAGPGTIDSPSTITFNTIDPLYLSLPGGTATTQTPRWIWGSFDGSTNDPVVYPDGTSITELENELLEPFIVNTSLPNGVIGASYSVTLSGAGGQPPYTWSLSPGSALPGGLTLSSGGQITGTPSGPAALYDVAIRITDSASSFNDVPFTLTIDQ